MLKQLVLLCALLSVVFAQKTIILQHQKKNVFLNTEYAGISTINNQNLLLVFDTSSPNVIVASQECLGGSCGCATTQKYVGPVDRSAAQEVDVTYFDFASASGVIITAPVTIANLTSQDQSIVLADQLGLEICQLGASGVVGLAPQAANGVTPVVKSFADAGLIENTFSIVHTRYASNGEHYGILTLGGTDTTFVDGDFIQTALVDDSSWIFPVDEVRIGDTIVGSNTRGLVDTSKAVILGPKEQVDNINQALGCTPTQVNPEINACVLNCSVTNLPDFTFVISGGDLSITSESYVQRDGTLCYSAFVPRSDLDHFLFGDILIDHYVCVFDGVQNVMKFAPSKEE